MNELRSLQKLGLSENESLVYIAALEEKESTPTVLAHKTKIKRSVVYACIDRLLKDGLLAHRSRKKRRYVVALPVKKAFDNYHEKHVHSVEKMKEVISQLTPHLKKRTSAKSQASSDNTVEYFYGATGLDYVVTKVMLIKEDMYSIGPFQFIIDFTGESEMFTKYTTMRMTSGTTLHSIREPAFKSSTKFTEPLGDLRRHKYIDIPEDTDAAISASGDYLAIVTEKNNDLEIALMKNAQAAQIFIFFFKELWDRLEE